MIRIVGLILLLLSQSARSEVTPPQLQMPVIDQAGVLSREETEQLNTQLRGMIDDIQMQIWTVRSLEGESIEGVSMRAAEAWKLGDKTKDNGVLILVALRERQMRIEIGHGLEGSIPDALAGRLVDHVMKPYFRRGEYYQGLSITGMKLRALARGEVSQDEVVPKTPRQSRRRLPASGLEILFMIVGMLVLRVFRPRGLFGMRGGASSWGRGGGSSWSGGGGSFGGGGASGNW